MVAAVFRVLAVVLVVDGDETDVMKWKILLDVVAAVDSVAAQAGKVFDNDAVDFSRLRVGQHTLELLALEMLSRYTVIGIYINDLNIRAEGKVRLHNLPLGIQRIAALSVELHGKPHIKRRFPRPYADAGRGVNNVLSAFPCHLDRLLRHCRQRGVKRQQGKWRGFALGKQL